MIGRLRAVVVLIALACAFHAHAQERHLRTYTMRHALAEQVAPVLATQLSAGSSVTPYYQQLILNVTDAEYRALQSLLEQLDKAPRSLLISVRKQSQQNTDSERYGVQGHIGNDVIEAKSGHDDGQVQSGGDWRQRSGARVTVDRGSAQSNRDSSQQVRAVEGMEAFVAVGNTMPIRTGAYGERALVSAQSGFYATARIVDDEVIVDIDQRDDHLQGRGIATQNLQTQVRGPIGEWLSLGGLSSSQTGSERAVTSYANNAAAAMADLAIKIELLGD